MPYEPPSSELVSQSGAFQPPENERVDAPAAKPFDIPEDEQSPWNEITGDSGETLAHFQAASNPDGSVAIHLKNQPTDGSEPLHDNLTIPDVTPDDLKSETAKATAAAKAASADKARFAQALKDSDSVPDDTGLAGQVPAMQYRRAQEAEKQANMRLASLSGDPAAAKNVLLQEHITKALRESKFSDKIGQDSNYGLNTLRSGLATAGNVVAQIPAAINDAAYAITGAPEYANARDNVRKSIRDIAKANPGNSRASFGTWGQYGFGKAVQKITDVASSLAPMVVASAINPAFGTAFMGATSGAGADMQTLDAAKNYEDEAKQFDKTNPKEAARLRAQASQVLATRGLYAAASAALYTVAGNIIPKGAGGIVKNGLTGGAEMGGISVVNGQVLSPALLGEEHRSSVYDLAQDVLLGFATSAWHAHRNGKALEFASDTTTPAQHAIGNASGETSEAPDAPWTPSPPKKSSFDKLVSALGKIKEGVKNSDEGKGKTDSEIDDIIKSKPEYAAAVKDFYTTGSESSGGQGDTAFSGSTPEAKTAAAAQERRIYMNDGTLSHAEIEAIAKRLGLDTPEKLAKWTEAQVLAEAQQTMANDPAHALKLVNRMTDNPAEPRNPVDTAIMNIHLQQLEERYDSKRKALASTPINDPLHEALSREFDAIEAALKAALKINFEKNSLAGSNLRAIQMRIGKDKFGSLPSLELTLEAQLKRPITPAEKAELGQKVDAYNDAQEAAEKARTEAEAEAATAKEGVKGKQTEIIKKIITSVTSVRRKVMSKQRAFEIADQLGQELGFAPRNRPAQTNPRKTTPKPATPKPATPKIYTGAHYNPEVIARSIHILAREAKTFTSFSTKALKQFGEWIKPHLAPLWLRAKSGLKAVHDYLKYVVRNSEEGSVNANPLDNANRRKDPETRGIFAYANEMDSANGVEPTFEAWEANMRANGFGTRATEKAFHAAQSSYKERFETGSAATPDDVVEKYKGTDISDEDLHSIALQLARSHVYGDPTLTADSEGNADRLVSLVQKSLEELGQEHSTDDVRSAITNYGKDVKATRTEAQKRLSELKQIILYQRKLISAKAKEPIFTRLFSPKKNEVARQIDKQLYDQLKANEAEARAIETGEQKAGRMKTREDRLINTLLIQINDLQAQIDEKIPLRAGKTLVKDTPRITELKKRRDALQDTLDSKRDPTGIIRANESRLRAANTGARNYTRRLDKGLFGSKEKEAGHPPTRAVLDAEKERDARRDAFVAAREKSGIPARQAHAKRMDKLEKALAEIEQHQRQKSREYNPEAPEKPLSPEETEEAKAIENVKKKIKDVRAAMAEEDAPTADEKAAKRRAQRVKELNGILDVLDAHIKAKTRPSVKSPVKETDTEIINLKQSIKDARDAIDGLNTPTPAELEALYNKRAKKAAEASKKHYDEKLAGKDFARKLPVEHPLYADTLAARTDAENAKKAFMEDADGQIVRAGERLQSAKERIAKRIVELNGHIAAETFPAKKGGPKFVADAAYNNSVAERKNLRGILSDRRAEGLASKASARMIELQKMIDSAKGKNTDTQKAELELMKQTLRDADAAKSAPTPPTDAELLQREKRKFDRKRASAMDKHARLIASGQVPGKKTPRQIVLDADARAKRISAFTAEADLNFAVEKIKMADDPILLKFVRLLAPAKRAIIFISLPIYLKLATAGHLNRPIMMLLEDTLTPKILQYAMPDVFEGAKGVAGSARMDWGDYLTGWRRGVTEMKGLRNSAVWKYGKTPNMMLYGAKVNFHEGNIAEKLTGHLHMAIKAPIWEAAFEVSVGRRARNEGYATQGEVPPEEMDAMKRAAVNDADHAIYINANKAVKAFDAGVNAAARIGGQPGELAAELIHMDSLIKKIPTNMVAEGGKYIFGSVLAPLLRYRLKKAAKDGKLTPRQYDDIARTFQKGVVGNAALAVCITLIVMGHMRVGGAFIPGEKRKNSDLEPGEVELFGQILPHPATHGGDFVALQTIGTAINDFQSITKDRKHPSGVIYHYTHPLLNAALGMVEDVPFVRGMSNTADSLQPGHEGANVRDTFAAGFVPPLLRTVAKMKDYHSPFNDAHPFLGGVGQLLLGQEKRYVTKRSGERGWQGAIPSIPGVPIDWTRQGLKINRHK